MFQGGISTMESISTNRSHSATQMTSSGNSSGAETHLQTSLVSHTLTVERRSCVTQSATALGVYTNKFEKFQPEA